MDYDTKCHDSRVCFLQKKDFRGIKRCLLLKCSYKDGKCPFCKEKGYYTNGKYYPYKQPVSRSRV